jgi:hypothetical protein
LQLKRVGSLAEEFELRHGVEAARGAGVAGDKDQVAVLEAAGGPLEIILQVDGLIVFVDAEEADVQIVARVLEVVGIAAEEGGGEFGREDEADVGVFFVFVEMKHSAGVERDHIAAEFRGCNAILLDGGHGGAARQSLIGDGHAGLGGGFYFVGDVFDVFEDVEFEIGALGFVGVRFGVVAGLHIVLAAGGEIVDAFGGDVMVGEHQPVRRDEGPGAAIIEPDGGEARVIEPGFGELEAVLGFDFRSRREIKEPHALVGAGEA